MTTFYVRWEIDIDANTPREAAEKALDIHRDTNSIATAFRVDWVYEEDGYEVTATAMVDLSK